MHLDEVWFGGFSFFGILRFAPLRAEHILLCRHVPCISAIAHTCLLSFSRDSILAFSLTPCSKLQLETNDFLMSARIAQ